MIKKVYKITMAIENEKEGYCANQRSRVVLAETALEAAEKVTLEQDEFIDAIESIAAIDVEASEESAKPEEGKKEEEKKE